MIKIPADITCDNCGRKFPDGSLQIRADPSPPYSAHRGTITVKDGKVLPDGGIACSDTCYDKLMKKTEHK
jgi:hypothetical protein